MGSRKVSPKLLPGKCILPGLFSLLLLAAEAEKSGAFVEYFIDGSRDSTVFDVSDFVSSLESAASDGSGSGGAWESGVSQGSGPEGARPKMASISRRPFQKEESLTERSFSFAVVSVFSIGDTSIVFDYSSHNIYYINFLFSDVINWHLSEDIISGCEDIFLRNLRGNGENGDKS